jgi:hypothetical protein
LPGELCRFHPFASLEKLSEKRGDPLGKGMAVGEGAPFEKKVESDIPVE